MLNELRGGTVSLALIGAKGESGYSIHSFKLNYEICFYFDREYDYSQVCQRSGIPAQCTREELHSEIYSLIESLPKELIGIIVDYSSENRALMLARTTLKDIKCRNKVVQRADMEQCIGSFSGKNGHPPMHQP